MHATAPHDRIHVGNGPSLQIPFAIWQELVLHAREARPDECCGLVTGDASQRYREVHRCRNVQAKLHAGDPIAHPRSAREAFSIAAEEYLRIVQEAESRGQRLTAIYHSHVGYALYFSELDQAYALGHPDADHIVISVVPDPGATTVEMGVFRWRDHGFVGSKAEKGAP